VVIGGGKRRETNGKKGGLTYLNREKCYPVAGEGEKAEPRGRRGYPEIQEGRGEEGGKGKGENDSDLI